jgi:glycosyltransferase involved in cell wall biosynthesis
MPTYNQAQWLPGALASVVRQDNHLGYPRMRVVVDDASTDATATVLRKTHEDHSVALLRHEANQGTAAAINTGAAHLADQVDALTWVSSDNVMEWDWLYFLEREVLQEGAGAAYGGFLRVTADRLSYHFTPYDPDKLISGLECYMGPAFLIRKDVWIEAGPHRGRISHDYDHWLRVEEVCWKRGLPIVGVDQPLCWYNAHDKRASVVRRHEFDAAHWQAEARKRRGLA